MVFSIPSVLTAEELTFVAKRLDDANFINGKTTAGWQAELVKHNTQVKTQTTYAQDLKELVKTAQSSILNGCPAESGSFAAI